MLYSSSGALKLLRLPSGSLARPLLVQALQDDTFQTSGLVHPRNRFIFRLQEDSWPCRTNQSCSGSSPVRSDQRQYLAQRGGHCPLWPSQE